MFDILLQLYNAHDAVKEAIWVPLEVLHLNGLATVVVERVFGLTLWEDLTITH